MPFATGHLDDMNKAGSGQLIGERNIVLSHVAFEDQLVVGRFAKLDAGSIDNIDASVAPVVAGVVLRDPAGALEDGNKVPAAYNSHIEVARTGLITVDVVAANTPAMFGAVFVINVAGADAGKATTLDDATTEPANAEFIEEIQSGVWSIRLK